MRSRLLAWGMGAAAGLLFAGIALAQAAWPVITKADLGGCAPVFAQAHRLELASLDREMAAACKRGKSKARNDDCAAIQQWADVSKDKPDLDWYFDGNETCKTDYPCFGPGMFNQARSGEDAATWVQLVKTDAALPVKVTPDMDFAAATLQGDRCIGQAWLRKYEAGGSSPRVGGNKSPRGKAGVGDAPAPAAISLFQPDAPRPAMVALTRTAAKACEDQIRAWQTESQSWQGTLDEINLRLGMMQRALYLGRCAAHADADRLAAAAEQTVVAAGARAAGAQTSAEQTTPVVNDCLTPVPPGDARNSRGVGVFLNTCAYPIYFSFCNVAPKSGSWAAAFSCESESSVGMDSVAANDVVPAVLGREVSHFACRKPALPVARYTPGKGLEGFCK